MKLAFKFNIFGVISFVVICGLFYWLCPLPSNPLWRAVVCATVAAFAFGSCFVIVKPK